MMKFWQMLTTDKTSNRQPPKRSEEGGVSEYGQWCIRDIGSESWAQGK